MHFIDTHSHLYKEYYPEDFSEVIARAIEANVKQAVLPCVNSNSIADIFDAVNKYPDNLFPLIGLHPTDVFENYREELNIMENHLHDSRIIGIGEIGMDLFHDDSFRHEQRDAFYIQLKWARELNMPLSIHIRNGYEDAIDVFKKFGDVQWNGILHCFSGGIQEAEWAIKHGFYLGIGGVVTFKNNKLQEIVQKVGLQHIVLETDSPFLAPTPHRGTRNESAYIPIIASKIAEICSESIEMIMQTTTENCYRLFPQMKNTSL